MIRKATEHDIDAVERDYTELLTHEKDNGSNSNWVLGVYPTRSVAEDSCRAGTLYVMECDGGICASMILNQVQSEEYYGIAWEYPARDDEVLILHTLCIPPSNAGRGYGTKMVRYAIEEARRMKCRVMRLDTYAGNQPASALYTKLGFRYAGIASVMLQGLIPEEQIFFELDLDHGM